MLPIGDTVMRYQVSWIGKDQEHYVRYYETYAEVNSQVGYMLINCITDKVTIEIVFGHW